MILERVSQDTVRDLRTSLYAHLEELPYEFYDHHRVGEIMSRMTGDMDAMRNLFANGTVTVYDNGLRDVQLITLRKQMSVMMQDPFIFSGTIMENIRYGRLDATDDEVIKAAKTVYAHDFITQLPNGYQTEVNERGSSLSQGQKQLISFARALLNDPKILILDEATSSIDTHTEMLIQKALEVLLKGRTSFVIAHRLSTIRNADCIMVVQDGHIAERGSHEELITLPGGHYRGLCEAQYRFMTAEN